MSKGNTANKKIYKRLKRTGIPGTIFSFIFYTLLALLIMFLTIWQFTKYIFVTKMEHEYKDLQLLAKTCVTAFENGTAEGFDELISLDYLITDRSGNVTAASGEDTRAGVKERVKFDIDSEFIDIYMDKDNIYYYIDYDRTLAFDFPALLLSGRRALYYPAPEQTAAMQDISDKEVKLSKSIIYYPVWMSVDIGDTEQSLVAKTFFSLNLREFYLLIEIAAVIAVLIMFLLLSMFIKSIKNIIRQKRTINYFYTDTVTGGGNWIRYLIKGDALLKRSWNRKKNFAVVNLVFVNYRNYCICHSIETGEKMLKQISGIITSSLSKKDEMCAHSSSSSFALILRYVNDEELDVRLKGLINRLEQTGTGHKFTFQAGVSMIQKSTDRNGYPVKRKDIDLESEYNNACTARETLADSGESGIAYFDEKIVSEQKWFEQVQERQKKALENEEFLVYYQPKYDPRTNTLKGAEALIRWQSPDLGFISPGKFIPLFEKNGFIVEIDHYMIRHVAADQKRWLDAGFKCVPVSVNVSRAHFIESDLAEQIRNMIDDAGCPHELIEIELTESAFFDDKKAMINTINKLKGYGFHVSMDDFGSGYSSLNSLKDMPLDVLKLDAEFFRGDFTGDRGEIVVSEAIKLAKSLNMKTVAEGVEVKEQVDFLAKEGCDMIQGFYFSKPVPSSDYEKKMGRPEQ